MINNLYYVQIVPCPDIYPPYKYGRTFTQDVVEAIWPLLIRYCVNLFIYLVPPTSCPVMYCLCRPILALSSPTRSESKCIAEEADMWSQIIGSNLLLCFLYIAKLCYWSGINFYQKLCYQSIIKT